jgi:uncharacterized UPF0160 family protein
MIKSKKLIKVATHNGTFHVDELFAISTLKLLYPDNQISINRTRDQDLIDAADWVIDVGGVYDHSARRYDHHQIGSPVRENGVPYAAFGLVWRHWGSQICGNEEIANTIESQFIQMIDGPDNGYPTTQSLVDGGRVPTLAMLPSLWRSSLPDIASTEIVDRNFNDLLDLTTEILQKTINLHTKRHQANLRFEKAYHEATDKSVIVVEKGDWPVDVSNYPETLFIVYHDIENNTWKAKCITDNSFNCRNGFPQNWRGLRDKELQIASDISGAVFVHRAGFLAVAESKRSILEMCSQAKS